MLFSLVFVAIDPRSFALFTLSPEGSLEGLLAFPTFLPAPSSRRLDTQFVSRMGLRDTQFVSRMGVRTFRCAVCIPDGLAGRADDPHKSFIRNTYGLPRKQRTYSNAKLFSCNTYKKQGGTSVQPKASSPSVSQRSDLGTFRRSDGGICYLFNHFRECILQTLCFQIHPGMGGVEGYCSGIPKAQL